MTPKMNRNDNTASEYERFDAGVTRILSVSHGELQRREAEWKRKRKRKKQAKSASRATRA